MVEEGEELRNVEAPRGFDPLRLRNFREKHVIGLSTWFFISVAIADMVFGAVIALVNSVS